MQVKKFRGVVPALRHHNLDQFKGLATPSPGLQETGRTFLLWDVFSRENGNVPAFLTAHSRILT
jgi:hypothetical protein